MPVGDWIYDVRGDNQVRGIAGCSCFACEHLRSSGRTITDGVIGQRALENLFTVSPEALISGVINASDLGSVAPGREALIGGVINASDLGSVAPGRAAYRPTPIDEFDAIERAAEDQLKEMMGKTPYIVVRRYQLELVLASRNLLLGMDHAAAADLAKTQVVRMMVAYAREEEEPKG